MGSRLGQGMWIPMNPADLLAEFFDNGLMTALALLVTDEETRLSKSEEAYLMIVARATYAAKGITTEKIRHAPETLLLPAPILADFLAQIREMPASSEQMRQSLLERLEKAAYLFQGPTSISLEKPLTIFSIKGLDEKWFALMTYVVQNFLLRHRAIRQDERYLAYIVEEASYLLRNAAGRRYLEKGSRGFRKLGIAQITLSQHPRDFLEAGQVVLSNAGTAFYLGMERSAVEKLHLAEELERQILEGIPGHCVLRIGNDSIPLTIWSNPVYRALFTTDPAERRAMRKGQAPTVRMVAECLLCATPAKFLSQRSHHAHCDEVGSFSGQSADAQDCGATHHQSASASGHYRGEDRVVRPLFA
jgi:hypothetical protein